MVETVLLFLTVIVAILSPLTIIGLVTVVAWANFKKQPGVDTSNWFNPIRLWWFFLTRPDMFAGLYEKSPYTVKHLPPVYRPAFPWLKKDELENMD